MTCAKNEEQPQESNELETLEFNTMILKYEISKIQTLNWFK